MIVLKKSPDQTGDRSENRRYARAKASRTASLWSLDQRLITRASMVLPRTRLANTPPAPVYRSLRKPIRSERAHHPL